MKWSNLKLVKISTWYRVDVKISSSQKRTFGGEKEFKRLLAKYIACSPQTRNIVSSIASVQIPAIITMSKIYGDEQHLVFIGELSFWNCLKRQFCKHLLTYECTLALEMKVHLGWIPVITFKFDLIELYIHLVVLINLFYYWDKF